MCVSSSLFQLLVLCCYVSSSPGAPMLRKNRTVYNLEYRWGAWGAFSPCSRSCGIGIKIRQRKCFKFGTTPVAVDGWFCAGNNKKYETCNTQSCPRGFRDFRELQCSFFNGLVYRGTNQKWKPFLPVLPASWKFGSANPCTLSCLPQGKYRFVVKFAKSVVDGTQCAKEPYSVCVAGKCIPVGCDYCLHSKASYDWCGVCGGDNSTCYWRTGIISRNITAGFALLIQIPKAARHIKIVERARNNVVLVLRNEKGIYFINGKTSLQYPSITKLVAGTVFYYHHAIYDVRGLESLHAEGPLSERLIVEGFTPEKSTTIKLKYKYILPKINSTSDSAVQKSFLDPSYAWQTLLYSKVQFGYVPPNIRKQTLSSESSLTDPQGLNTANKTQLGFKPFVTGVVQRFHQTTAGSKHLEHSLSPVPTDPPKAKKKRPVKVSTASFKKKVTKNLLKLEDRKTGTIHFIKNNTKENIRSAKEKGTPIFVPEFIDKDEGLGLYENFGTGPKESDSDDTITSEIAATTPVPKNFRYSWQVNIISPCSITCKAGVQIHFFSCYCQDGKKVDDKMCEKESKPDPSYHKCSREECQARWVVGLWSECSRTCNEGVQVRNVRCWRMLAHGFDSSVHDYLCVFKKKPASVRKCKKAACGPQWEVSEWEKCSSICGYGIQRRYVRCNTNKNHSCDASSKPSERQSCIHPPCVNSWQVTEWNKCSGSCSEEFKRRNVFCQNKEGKKVDDRYCDKNTKPLTMQLCGTECVPLWVPQDYISCSVECGTGIMTRKVVCGSIVNGNFHIQSDAHCHHLPRPASFTVCQSAMCSPIWFTTEWSECSETCGANSVRIREVKCYYNNKPSEDCDKAKKPETVKNCVVARCPKQNETDCVDNAIINCNLVKHAQLCSHEYYKKACCRFCQESLKHKEESDKH